MGQIADILQARGQLDEALRIRQEEELPVYAKLGAARDILIARTKLGLLLLTRDQPGDREAARNLLALACQAAESLHLPEADPIRQLLDQHGLLPSS
jgi:hypothetical protein